MRQCAGLTPEGECSILSELRRFVVLSGVFLTLCGASNVAAGNLASPSRLALRVEGQGVLFVGRVRLRCVSQAASNIVCTDAVSLPRGSYATVRERPRSGWRFVGWSGACRGVSPTCHLRIVRPATVAATFHRS